jgi:NitT/TauT family transport system substrate-binding protein
MRRGTGPGLLAVVLAAALLGCSRGGGKAGIAVALNWKPEPEFGGIYEAERSGEFAKAGLHVELTGGPGAPVVQMVDSGQVAYGVAAADEVVMARDRGADVVAVFATYQTNPQGLMAHGSTDASSLRGLFAEGGTLALEPGLPYVKFLQKHYDLSRWKIVPYGYSIAPFLGDPHMVIQCFVTAEPIAARRRGAHPKVFLIAESGYDPYAAVVITRGKRLREHPKEVAALVGALRAGWRAYLADPGPADALMEKANPEMDAETFRLAAEAQKPLIETPLSARDGVGTMTLERWTRLADQLHELGLVGHVDPAACFSNPPN